MSRLLINEPPLMVLPSLAVKIGLNEAIFVQQLHYLLQMSHNERDGRVWVYNTNEEWESVFPFLSSATIRRTFKSLEDLNLVISSTKMNRHKSDRTKWFSLDYDALEAIAQNDQMACSKRSNASDQNDQIPFAQNDQVTSDQNEQLYNHKNKTTNQKTTTESSKNTRTKKPKFDASEFLQSHNVSDLVIQDFIAHRKNKKAEITMTALNGIIREAGKANISLERALTIAIERNWVSFNASWKWQDDAITIGSNVTPFNAPNQSTGNKQIDLENRTKQVIEQYLQGQANE